MEKKIKVEKLKGITQQLLNGTNDVNLKILRLQSQILSMTAGLKRS